MLSISANNDWSQMIESYKNDLLKQYRSVVHEDFKQEAIETVSQAEEIPEESDQPSHTNETSGLSDIGYLQVRVSTENQAEPIVGAVVTISRMQDNKTELIRTAITDQSGLIPLVELPTKDRSLSLTPDTLIPYVVYEVNVAADGYYTNRFENIPVYGGVTAIQNVIMLPLPEQSDSDIPIVYTTPTNESFS